MIDLFQQFDTNGDGFIAQKEFLEGMHMLGLRRDLRGRHRRVSRAGSSPLLRLQDPRHLPPPPPPIARAPHRPQVDQHEVSELFRTFDEDGSGAIDFEELNKLLRAGNTIKLSALAKSAAGLSNWHKGVKGANGDGATRWLPAHPEALIEAEQAYAEFVIGQASRNDHAARTSHNDSPHRSLCPTRRVLGTHSRAQTTPTWRCSPRARASSTRESSSLASERPNAC